MDPWAAAATCGWALAHRGRCSTRGRCRFDPWALSLRPYFAAAAPPDESVGTCTDAPPEISVLTLTVLPYPLQRHHSHLRLSRRPCHPLSCLSLSSCSEQRHLRRGSQRWQLQRRTSRGSRLSLRAGVGGVRAKQTQALFCLRAAPSYIFHPYLLISPLARFFPRHLPSLYPPHFT